MEERHNERGRIERLVEDFQKQIITNESEILKTESRIEYLTHQAENDRNDLQILNNNQSAVDESIEQIDKRISDIERENSNLQQEIASNQKALESKRALRNEIREKIDNLEKKYKEVDLAISKLGAELKVLREAEESLAGFTSGSKEFVQAARGNRIQARFALLLDHLKVPQEYELAFSAALGEMIEGIILDEGSSTHEILEFLEKNKTSRTVFLPRWWNVKPLNKNNENWNALSASDLVKGNDEYAKLIKNILSATLIASSAEEAEKLVQQLPQGMKVVTIKGEVFDTRGTITAGNEFRVKNLSRKREKESIEKEIESFRGEADDLKKDLDNQKANLTQLSDEIRQLSDLEQQQQKKIQQLGIDSHKAQIEKSQKQDQLRDIRKRLEQINAASDNRSKEGTELKGNLKTFRNQLAEKQKVLEEHFQKINELQIGRASCRERV